MPKHVISAETSTFLDPCRPAALTANPPLAGRTDDPKLSGVDGGHCGTGVGVTGWSAGGNGIVGTGGLTGVIGESEVGRGIEGRSKTAVGVWGSSETAEGVHGETRSTRFAAVAGISLNSKRDPEGGASAGVWGSSKSGEGVHGETQSDFFAAVAGIQLNPQSTGAGVYGEHRGEGPAGFFKGNVVVTKDIFLGNGDCAEDFDVSGSEEVAPGTVMVINQDGALHQCQKAYDKRVAGVISGAGGCEPAIILDRKQLRHNRVPIALVGKVYCKADAQYSPIEIGDLLTTSQTPGHAMKAEDPLKAFGSVIGKALQPLKEGRGTIPILISSH